MTEITVYQGHELTKGSASVDPMDAIENANLANSTKKKYSKALDAFFIGGGDLRDTHSIADHARTLGNSGRKLFKAALALWQLATIANMNAQATPGNTGQIDAIERRFKAAQAGIKTKAPKGQKAHTWLSAEQVKDLLGKPDRAATNGKRDLVVLGLAFLAGLRRSEIANLEWADVVTQPTGKVLSVLGKGDKRRTIPLCHRLDAILLDWQAVTGKVGHIVRSMDRHGNLGDSMSDVSVFRTIASYGVVIGAPRLAAHDARRSFAQGVFTRTRDIVAVQKLLGHGSIETTRTYLEIDAASLGDAVNWLD